LQLYLALFLGLIPLPAKIQEDLIPYVRFIRSQAEKRNWHDSDHILQLPFWAIISFGAYLLGKLGYNVMTFHDVPEAHKELMAEIEIARADLKKMGVEVD
jgi:dolichyl-phosphate mannosyltransferase polypeptide 3